MPAQSTEFKNAVLDGILGPDRGANAPDEFQVEGWMDDPSRDGASEADFVGYTPAVLDSDDWNAAEGGQISSTGLVSLGVPAGASSDAIRFFALRNTTSGELAFSGPLSAPLYVSEGASPVQVHPVVKVP